MAKFSKKITATYERCHDLEAVGDRTQQFANPDDWIKSAADQGHPVAESDEALSGFAAVQTKDPEALFNIGQAQGYLNNFNGDATKNQLAWWLVACQRGLPCGSNSEFQTDVALNDGLLGLSGADLICAMASEGRVTQ